MEGMYGNHVLHHVIRSTKENRKIMTEEHALMGKTQMKAVRLSRCQLCALYTGRGLRTDCASCVTHVPWELSMEDIGVCLLYSNIGVSITSKRSGTVPHVMTHY